jgi:hypothetical protein
MVADSAENMSKLVHDMRMFQDTKAQIRLQQLGIIEKDDYIEDDDDDSIVDAEVVEAEEEDV